MFTGGREVDAGIATLFGVVKRIRLWLCLVVYRQQVKTLFFLGLLKQKAKQWQMDTLLSVAVTLGFVTALVSLHFAICTVCRLCRPYDDDSYVFLLHQGAV